MSEKLKADGYEPAIDEHGKIVNGVPYIALSTAQALADALEAAKLERDALRKELESALSLMREHGIGLNAVTLDDAIRQALQAVIVERDNCVVLRSEWEARLQEIGDRLARTVQALADVPAAPAAEPQPPKSAPRAGDCVFMPCGGAPHICQKCDRPIDHHRCCTVGVDMSEPDPAPTAQNGGKSK